MDLFTLFNVDIKQSIQFIEERQMHKNLGKYF